MANNEIPASASELSKLHKRQRVITQSFIWIMLSTLTALGIIGTAGRMGVISEKTKLLIALLIICLSVFLQTALLVMRTRLLFKQGPGCWKKLLRAGLAGNSESDTSQIDPEAANQKFGKD